MTRCTRCTRVTRVTCWAIYTIQVNIVDHRGSKGSYHILDIANRKDTRSIIVRRNSTLKSVHHIGGIHHHNAVARHVGEFRGDRQDFRGPFLRGYHGNGRDCLGVEAVGMTRWTRDTGHSRCTRVTRWTINAVQIHIVTNRCSVCSYHIVNLANHDDTRSELIGNDCTLKAIHAVGRIHDDYAVSCDVGELRSDRQSERCTFFWCVKLYRGDCAGVVSVGMTRCTRCTGGTSCSCCTRFSCVTCYTSHTRCTSGTRCSR